MSGNVGSYPMAYFDAAQCQQASMEHAYFERTGALPTRLLYHEDRRFWPFTRFGQAAFDRVHRRVDLFAGWSLGIAATLAALAGIPYIVKVLVWWWS